MKPFIEISMAYRAKHLKLCKILSHKMTHKTHEFTVCFIKVKS